MGCKQQSRSSAFCRTLHWMRNTEYTSTCMLYEPPPWKKASSSHGRMSAVCWQTVCVVVICHGFDKSPQPHPLPQPETQIAKLKTIQRRWLMPQSTDRDDASVLVHPMSYDSCYKGHTNNVAGNGQSVAVNENRC